MEILVDIIALEVYSTQAHNLLVHLTGGQMIAQYADNLRWFEEIGWGWDV